MDCAAAVNRAAPQGPRDRGKTVARGYNASWDRISKKARRIQPFCTDCGTEDRLQADHLPSAWDRWHQGRSVQLVDVDVVCAACNTDRGSSRPGSDRYETWVRAGKPRGHRGAGVTGGAPDPGAQGGEPVSVAVCCQSEGVL